MLSGFIFIDDKNNDDDIERGQTFLELKYIVIGS